MGIVDRILSPEAHRLQYNVVSPLVFVGSTRAPRDLCRGGPERRSAAQAAPLSADFGSSALSHNAGKEQNA